MKIVASILCITLLLGGAAQALVKPLTDQELVDGAENIALGAVVSKKVRWLAGGSKLYTLYRVQVQAAYKGALSRGETITVVILGGYDPVRQVGLTISSQPHLEVGEAAVFYLADVSDAEAGHDLGPVEQERWNIPNPFIVYGGQLGKHEVRVAPGNGEEMVWKANEGRAVPLTDYVKALEEVAR